MGLTTRSGGFFAATKRGSTLPMAGPSRPAEFVQVADDIGPHKVPSATVVASQLGERGPTRQELLKPVCHVVAHSLVLHAPRSPVRGAFRWFWAGVMFRRDAKQAGDLPGVK